MSSTGSIDRRRFLKQSAALASAAAVTQVLGTPAVVSARAPGAKFGIAVIGCGGQGSGNPGVAAGERLVALVDIDEKYIDKAI